MQVAYGLLQAATAQVAGLGRFYLRLHTSSAQHFYALKLPGVLRRL